ncbi:MAG: hypothetical protein IPM23_12995 [Candidatus Melainabacteria bacterium]|nr:hypothetical protein [Candidatus Melainabacteria bacterium]
MPDSRLSLMVALLVGSCQGLSLTAPLSLVASDSPQAAWASPGARTDSSGKTLPAGKADPPARTGQTSSKTGASKTTGSGAATAGKQALCLAKTYQGTIGKYKVKMNLTLANGKVTGTYSYNHVGKPINLRGTVDRSKLFEYPGDNCELEELDAGGKTTGTFSGALTDYEFFGNWTAGKKSLPFSLKSLDSMGAGSVSLTRMSHDKYRQGDHEGLVYYPAVSSPNKAVEKKLARALTFETVHDPDLGGWLSRAVYYVNYDRNNILDLTWWVDGFGAYPDASFKQVRLNLKTGAPITAEDVFVETRRGQLAQLVDAAMQKKINARMRESSEDGDVTSFQDIIADARFAEENLDSFSIGGEGITFFYDFGFPHAAKACEPDGFFFFPYWQLKGYLKKDGPLAMHAR